ncbi:MAG: WYL domain-containing protein [Deltaproteobacteria bacterium]|nr:WYL domain-containing protein [Deltaproteobacteria bacterium]
MTSKTIQTAIEQRRSIIFEYIKPGKVRGKRIGNPHAIFVMHLKDGSRSTKVHIFQTGGVSDSRNLPDFRTFDLEDITNVTYSEDDKPFEISSKYNPNWEGYKDVIVKI